MPKPSWHRNSFSSLCQWFTWCQLRCTPPSRNGSHPCWQTKW